MNVFHVFRATFDDPVIRPDTQIDGPPGLLGRLNISANQRRTFRVPVIAHDSRLHLVYFQKMSLAHNTAVRFELLASEWPYWSTANPTTREEAVANPELVPPGLYRIYANIIPASDTVFEWRSEVGIPIHIYDRNPRDAQFKTPQLYLTVFNTQAVPLQMVASFVTSTTS